MAPPSSAATSTSLFLHHDHQQQEQPRPGPQQQQRPTPVPQQQHDDAPAVAPMKEKEGQFAVLKSSSHTQIDDDDDAHVDNHRQLVNTINYGAQLIDHDHGSYEDAINILQKSLSVLMKKNVVAPNRPQRRHQQDDEEFPAIDKMDLDEKEEEEEPQPQYLPSSTSSSPCQNNEQDVVGTCTFGSNRSSSNGDSGHYLYRKPIFYSPPVPTSSFASSSLTIRPNSNSDDVIPSLSMMAVVVVQFNLGLAYHLWALKELQLYHQGMDTDDDDDDNENEPILLEEDDLVVTSLLENALWYYEHAHQGLYQTICTIRQNDDPVSLSSSSSSMMRPMMVVSSSVQFLAILTNNMSEIHRTVVDPTKYIDCLEHLFNLNLYMKEHFPHTTATTTGTEIASDDGGRKEQGTASSSSSNIHTSNLATGTLPFGVVIDSNERNGMVWNTSHLSLNEQCTGAA